MAVTLVSCYFFPFILFFLAQLALPKSSTTFILGIAGVSISTLILYFQLKDSQLKNSHLKDCSSATATITSQTQPIQQKVPRCTQLPQTNSSLFFKSVPLGKPTAKIPNLKAIVTEQERLINLYKEDKEQKERLVLELQKNLEETRKQLQTKESQCQSQEQELANLKFEMYTLLRIDSYMSPKESVESNKLVTASF